MIMHEINIINIRDNNYVIKTKKDDFRLSIFTNGIVVERGCYLDAGKYGYIWETKGHLFYEDNRVIKKRTKTIAEKIIKEVIAMIYERELVV